MNKQITEDYVSYEIAKLLKEKGFDKDINRRFSPHFVYNNDGRFSGPSWDTEYNAPTLQMALKWLREVHNIHIQVLRYPAKIKKGSESNKYSKPWYYQYSNLTEIDGIDTEFIGMDEYDTYEQAVEAALLYVLKDLI